MNTNPLQKHDASFADEPWLANLAQNTEQDADHAFVARVMAAPASSCNEPWLEHLTMDCAKGASGDAQRFARRTEQAFTHARRRRSLVRPGVSTVLGLAACIALALLLQPATETMPVEHPRHPAVLDRPPTPVAASFNPASRLLASLQTSANNTLNRESRKALSTAVGSLCDTLPLPTMPIASTIPSMRLFHDPASTPGTP